MPVTSVEKDAEALTLTLIAEFPVPVRRLWEAFADPRQLERFWGPEGYPATFTRHDVTKGGRADYFMTGPDGERYFSFWEFLDVDEGRSFTVLEGFSHEDGTTNADLPITRVAFVFEAVGAGARVVVTTHFPSREGMATLVEMGVDEGMESAMGQIDAVLGAV